MDGTDCARVTARPTPLRVKTRFDSFEHEKACAVDLRFCDRYRRNCSIFLMFILEFRIDSGIVLYV